MHTHFDTGPVVIGTKVSGLVTGAGIDLRYTTSVLELPFALICIEGNL